MCEGKFPIRNNVCVGSGASPPAVGFDRRTSAAPQKRQSAIKMRPVVKGQNQKPRLIVTAAQRRSLEFKENGVQTAVGMK